MTLCSYDASLMQWHFHVFSGRNVFHLIALREISPRTKHVPKRRWGEASKPVPKTEATRDARRGLLSWYTTNFTLYLSILINSCEMEAHNL